MPNRERQISLLVALGLSNKEIGSLLNMAEGAVRARLSLMFVRYKIKSRLDLAVRTMTAERPFASSVEEDAIRAAICRGQAE
jgi:DNA-binding NarL/FixJ family response regulator